ncbi:MAG: Usg family protein [Acidiphilium sp. 37-64-53]|nr:MAG: Usg family protein [Acidiphilium sp. 37-64-53]OZB25985.1 MAG: Usg family protein [Acidiphilium sp. 34-64-41]
MFMKQRTRWHRAFSTGYEGDAMSLSKQLQGYRLTTAEILYHMPDHPGVLQSFVWQELDIAPRYPVLNGFLAFWARQIEGRLHSVRVGSAALISPGELRHGSLLTLQ